MIDDAEREHLRRELAAIEAYRRGQVRMRQRWPKRCNTRSRNCLPDGYTHRPWGTFAKIVEFEPGQGGTVVLIRSASGKLLRVERTKRALSLAAARRKKDA